MRPPLEGNSVAASEGDGVGAIYDRHHARRAATYGKIVLIHTGRPKFGNQSMPVEQVEAALTTEHPAEHVLSSCINTCPYETLADNNSASPFLTQKHASAPFFPLVPLVFAVQHLP